MKLLRYGEMNRERAGLLDDQGRIRARVMELGVEIVNARLLASVGKGSVQTVSLYGGATDWREFASVVMVTSRTLNDALYHALAADEPDPDGELVVSARLPDGLIMGLRHREHAVEGVQFHPESVLTEHGHELLKNFLR